MTCVHKRLSTYDIFFLSKPINLIFFDLPSPPLLSFLKVLLTMTDCIEKSSSKCQSCGSKVHEVSGFHISLPKRLQQLLWQAQKITFFLNVVVFTCPNFLTNGLKVTFIASKISFVEVNHFPDTISFGLKARDSDISQNIFSRFVVFSRTGERQNVVRA